MIQYKHILITLALLLTAVTGAWAQEEVLLTTVTATGHDSYSQSPDGMVTVTLNNIDSYHYTYGWLYSGSVTVEAAQGYTITRCVFKQNPSSKPNRVLVDDLAPFTATMVDVNNGEEYYVSAATSHGDAIGDDFMNGISTIEVYGYLAEPPIEVTPVAGKTNEWTFAMPGSDVVLTPQYAPAAQLAENGAPAAVSGLEIAADAAIITAGQSAQGTLLYAVGTSETEKPALTAFAATLPNAKDQTAAGTYYVWYYIQGQDTPQGQEPTAENTFNDSEIMGPVIVELLTNEHTLNIKQSPNITVTVAGTAKTPTDDKVTPVTTGQEVKIKAKEGYKFRKVEVKKGGAAAPATVLSGALVDGATIKVNFKWRMENSGDYVQGVYNAASGTFTVSKGGYDWGFDDRAVYKVEKSGDNIIIGAGFSGYNDEGMVWTFNTTNDTYTTTNGTTVNAHPDWYGLISVTLNGTDITSQLSELK